MSFSGNTLSIPKYRQSMLSTMALASILGVTPELSNAGDLDWTIAPYLWASDVGLDVDVNSDPAIGTDVPFSSSVDKLDGAFMGHIEMSADNYGMFFDAIYIKLADSTVVPVGPGGPVFGDLLVDSDLKLKLYELGGFYRMGSPDLGSRAFDILLGVRQIDVDQALDIVLPGPGATPINKNLDVSETDIFFGARIVGRFNDKWSYKLRADYGGGGTEGTVNALAAVGYTFGESGLFSIDLGYRYMSIDLKSNPDGSVFETDLTMSGPVIGFIFTF